MLNKVQEMFEAGAHYGYSKSKRHPSVKDFIYGVKNNALIFDLEKTEEALKKAKNFAQELGAKRATLLFVGGKNEARPVTKWASEELNMPYVAGRWIGGTITNFSEIKKRVQKLIDLTEKQEKGELDKYTKKEQLLISRDMEDLEKTFGGIISMKRIPEALFVIDSGYEKIAVAEAKTKNIPIISLSSSDCNLDEIDYPIPGNDSAKSSIEFFVREIVESYKEGLKKAPAPKEEGDKKKNDNNRSS